MKPNPQFPIKNNKSLSARNSLIFEILPIKPSSKITNDLPPINPDCTLSRNSILELDRRKRFQSFVNKETSNDVSYLVDSLSSKMSPKFSKNFSEDFNKSFPDSKILPTSRMEIEQLSSWLGKMKEIYLPDLDTIKSKNLLPSSEVVQKVEEIYLPVLKELHKQISVQSRPRGELLETIIETLRFIWKRYPDHLLYLLNKDREKFEKQINELKSNQKFELNKCKSESRDLENYCKKIEEEKGRLLIEINNITSQFNEYKSDVAQYIESTRKTIEHTGTQTDAVPHSDSDSVSNDRRLVRTYTLKERIDYKKLNFHLEAETFETEEKSPISIKKEKFLIELQKSIEDLEINQEIDFNSLIDTIYSQTENLFDWLSGFRQAQSMLSPKKSPYNNQMAFPIEAPADPPKINPIKLTPYQISEPKIKTASYLLKTMLKKTQSELHDYSKIPQKKVLKYINVFIYHSFNKQFSSKFKLPDLILQELFNKYTIKKIAERKFKELIAGCIFNMDESPKIRLFSCAFGCGSYFSYNNYSLNGSQVFIKLYENMISSRTGMIIDTADPLDIEFYPVSRCLDVIKQVFGKSFSLDKMTALCQIIKKISEFDMSSANKEGVIKLDNFLEFCMKAFEELNESVTLGVSLAADSISDMKYLTKGEAWVLIKNLAPRKPGIVNLIEFDQNNEVDLSEFRDICLHNGALCIEQVKKFFENTEKNWKVVQSEVKEAEQEIEKLGDISNSLSLEEWEGKFEEMNFVIRGKRTERCLYMWHLLKSELGSLRLQQ